MNIILIDVDELFETMAFRYFSLFLHGNKLRKNQHIYVAAARLKNEAYHDKTFAVISLKNAVMLSQMMDLKISSWCFLFPSHMPHDNRVIYFES